jgi:hypothetical protein
VEAQEVEEGLHAGAATEGGEVGARGVAELGEEVDLCVFFGMGMIEFKKKGRQGDI